MGTYTKRGARSTPPLLPLIDLVEEAVEEEVGEPLLVPLGAGVTADPVEVGE